MKTVGYVIKKRSLYPAERDFLKKSFPEFDLRDPLDIMNSCLLCMSFCFMLICVII